MRRNSLPSLPLEVWQNVFRYFPFTVHYLCRIERVCKLLYVASHTSNLWFFLVEKINPVDKSCSNRSIVKKYYSRTCKMCLKNLKYSIGLTMAKIGGCSIKVCDKCFHYNWKKCCTSEGHKLENYNLHINTQVSLDTPKSYCLKEALQTFDLSLNHLSYLSFSLRKIPYFSSALPIKLYNTSDLECLYTFVHGKVTVKSTTVSKK